MLPNKEILPIVRIEKIISCPNRSQQIFRFVYLILITKLPRNVL